MIKQTRERLIIISPFLKFNDRMKELPADKDRMKIDAHLVYDWRMNDAGLSYQHFLFR